MQKIKQSIRLLVILAALGCIVMTATNTLLFAHLWANPTQAYCHENHDHENEPLNSHNSDHCNICQVLLGSTGKYISLNFEAAGFTVDQIPFTCRFVSQFIYQYDIGPLAARGPPSCC